MKNRNHHQLSRTHAFRCGACCCLVVLNLILFSAFLATGHINPAIVAWAVGIVSLVAAIHHNGECSHHVMLSSFDDYESQNLFQ